MSTEASAETPQGDPPPETSWRFSGRVVTFIQTRDQAASTVRFFAFIRDTIVGLPRREMTTTSGMDVVSQADAERWAAGDFSGAEKADVLVHALRVIARDPASRADTLLALEAHTAYLCGLFGLPEPA